MSYRIIVRPDYVYPVKLNVLAENGAVMSHTFNAKFRRLSQAEIDEVKASVKTDADLVRKVMIGWEGVEGADGSSLDFNETSLGLLLEDNGVAWAIARAWYESIDKELVKN